MIVRSKQTDRHCSWNYWLFLMSSRPHCKNFENQNPVRLGVLRHCFGSERWWGGWCFGGTVALDCQVLSENESQAPIAEDKGAFLGAGFWVNFLPHDTWPIGLHSGHVLPVMAGPARCPAGGE